MRDSRPRFSGVGCVVLSLVPACHAGGREFESRRPRQYPQTREPRPDERDQADATFQRVEEILQVVFIARALGDGFGVAGVGHGLLGLTRGQRSWELRLYTPIPTFFRLAASIFRGIYLAVATDETSASASTAASALVSDSAVARGSGPARAGHHERRARANGRTHAAVAGDVVPKPQAARRRAAGDGN